MPPKPIQNLARQLLASDPANIGASSGQRDQVVRACEKLRVPLTKLSGNMGFSSLLSRALALAQRRSPSLARLRVEPDGKLTESNEIQTDMDDGEATLHAGIVLMAELLGLLEMFIGAPLMVSLVRDAWPDVSIGTLTSKNEEKA